jgi:hypothetical protein
MADAGRSRPASADFQDADSASCKARRSSSVRSSPSSSATRSTTVPSGKAVGSSRTRRPFSTRARSGLMRLLYGFPAIPRKRSSCPTEPVDLLKPDGDLVPTAWNWGRHSRRSANSLENFTSRQWDTHVTRNSSPSSADSSFGKTAATVSRFVVPLLILSDEGYSFALWGMQDRPMAGCLLASK